MRPASFTWIPCRTTGSSTGWTWERQISSAPRRSGFATRLSDAGGAPEQVSFIMLELGGAFTAGVAVEKRPGSGRRWEAPAGRSGGAPPGPWMARWLSLPARSPRRPLPGWGGLAAGTEAGAASGGHPGLRRGGHQGGSPAASLRTLSRRNSPLRTQRWRAGDQVRSA